jgi:hypothetical protein
VTTSSGVTIFNPSLGELVIYAFQLIGIRPTEILQEHMQSARMAANLLLSRLNVDTPNLWKVSLFSQPLTAGVSTYSYDPTIITVLDAYISVVGTDGTAIDRIILPITRSEYASYPNKTQQGPVTVFWADRLINPTITLWPVPDTTQTFLKYYFVSQIEDAVLSNGTGMDLPNYYLEPFALGLSARLAMIWAPDKATALDAAFERSYALAKSQNTEAGDIYVSPMLNSYFR